MPWTVGQTNSSTPAVRNRIIGMLGDSRANNSGKNGISENIGPLHWACMVSRQRLTFHSAYNFSTGGYTTKEIIDNHLDAACACEAGSMYVLAGTNDRTAMTPLQTIANLSKIVDRLVAAGKDVYIESELPRGDTTYTNYRLTASKLDDHLQVHRWILSLTGKQRVYPIDSYPVTAVSGSATGDALLGITIDGLHPNAKGAYLIGAKGVAAQIVAKYPDEPYVLPVAVDDPVAWINANPMLTGTGGTPLGTGGSGSLANSYKGAVGSTVGGITRVYSKTVEGYQRVVIGGTASSGSNPQLDIIKLEGLRASIPDGGRVYAVADMELAASSSGIVSLQLGVHVVTADAQNVYVWDGERYDTTSLMPADRISGVWMTQPIDVPAGATAVNLLVRCYGVTSDTSAGTVIVKSLGIRSI
jgi:lysophospholipase L1-like esterase